MSDNPLASLTDKDLPLSSMKGHISECKVVRIIDGDSISIICYDQRRELLKLNARMMGIDTPELSAFPNYAKKARNFLISLVTNVHIDLENMSSSRDLQGLIDENTKILYVKFGSEDKYGRALVELYEESEDIGTFSKSINHMMILSKKARSYDGGTKSQWMF